MTDDSSMETLHFEFEGSRRRTDFAPILVGVVGSGNLEVLLEPAAHLRCHIDIRTSARGFGPIWEAVARDLSVATFAAGLKPADKIARLEALKLQGHRVLMVGDGLNDAPALAAAHVSLSPISASHLAQAHADGVFLGEQLGPVAAALALARKARRLMLQNLWLSVAYNAVAVPIAVSGHASPLVAALAMSGSSVLVTLNALRARGTRELPS
jgi:malonate decarboxylase acyl carrier protein